MHKVKNEGAGLELHVPNVVKIELWQNAGDALRDAVHRLYKGALCSINAVWVYGTGVYVIVFSTLTGVPTTNAQQHYVRIC